jgi:hypothetical protein
MVDLYSLLKNKAKDLANALVNLPKSNVWVHEKAIYNLIGIKGSNTHGKREVLTFLLKGIQRGSFGNRQKKEYIALGYSIPNISNDSEENDFNICYQQYGGNEEFASGTLGDNPIISKPRWFRVGGTVTDVKTQIEIVNALTGEEKGLSADVAKRRRTYYKRFVAGNDDDGGYRRHDVSDIIDNYEEIWSESVGAKSDTRMGAQRKYNLEDRERIEDVLRLMIVASDICGKLEVKDGQIVPNNSLRRSRGDGLDARTPNPNPITPASAKPTAATKPTPKTIQFTPMVKATGRNSIDDALLLQNLKCTNDEGFISWKKVSELASLELLFHNYDMNLKLTDCDDRVNAANAAERDRAILDVNLKLQTFDYNNLARLSAQQVSASKTNIRNARKDLIENLHGHFVPTEKCFLYQWVSDSHAYSSGCAVQTSSNFQKGGYNEHQSSITLSAAWILRHIIYSHNLPVKTALMLWAEFHVLILRKPIDPDFFVSEKTLWKHVHRLHFIDNALVTRKFQSFISERTPNGFLRCYYTSSDDSKHSDSSAEIAESAALTCLSSFQKIDEHYTYTCVDSDVPTLPQTTGEDGDEEVINTYGRDDDDDDDDESDRGLRDGLCRSSQRKRRSNVRLSYPGEESSSDEEEEEEEEEDDDDDNDAPVSFT